MAVLLAGGAVWDRERILMDAKEAVQACQALPETRFVAVHLEALDHCPVGRDRLAWKARPTCGERMQAQANGASLTFGKRAGGTA